MAKNGKRTWHHVKLGDFTYDGMFWVGTISLPSLSIPINERVAGQVAIEIESRVANEECPNELLVEAVSTLVNNDQLISARVINAIWQDLSGEGQPTKNWWHGIVHKQDSARFSTVLPFVRSDLFNQLNLQTVVARCDEDAHKTAIVELCFRCLWEKEHGLGVLVEDANVVGIGYSNDVTPFSKLWKDRMSFKNPFTGKDVGLE